MQRHRAIKLLVIAVAYSALPILAYAAGTFTGPIVPSGAATCAAGFGAFSQIVEGVLGLLISLGILIAVLILAYGGFLLVLNPMNPENRTTAKKIMINAAIGFILTLGAWLIVNTLLTTLGAGGVLGATQGLLGGGTCLQVHTQTAINGGASGSTGLNGSGGGTGECPGYLICNAQNQCQTDPNLDPGAEGSTGQSGQACNTPGSQGICQTGLICDQTDVCSPPPGAQNPQICSGGSGGSGPGDPQLAQKIYQASQAYYNTDTSAGPDHGRLACAWSVNNILSNAGISHIDDNSVASMESALKGGRGTAESQSDAVAGDIVIEAGDGHVGICQNAGCTGSRGVLSNSSSKHAFVWYSDVTFSPTYHDGVGRFYRVNN